MIYKSYEDVDGFIVLGGPYSSAKHCSIADTIDQAIEGGGGLEGQNAWSKSREQDARRRTPVQLASEWRRCKKPRKADDGEASTGSSRSRRLDDPPGCAPSSCHGESSGDSEKPDPEDCILLEEENNTIELQPSKGQAPTSMSGTCFEFPTESGVAKTCYSSIPCNGSQVDAHLASSIPDELSRSASFEELFRLGDLENDEVLITESGLSLAGAWSQVVTPGAGKSEVAACPKVQERRESPQEDGRQPHHNRAKRGAIELMTFTMLSLASLVHVYRYYNASPSPLPPIPGDPNLIFVDQLSYVFEIETYDSLILSENFITYHGVSWMTNSSQIKW